MDDAPPVRSPLERQLNLGLMVVMVVSALIVVYGVVFVVTSWDGEERSRFEALQLAFVFMFLPGLVVLFTARSARRRLQDQVVSSRLYGILAGVFAMLAGLPLITTLFGLAGFVAGLFTLTCALLLKKDLSR